jgi:hypothetical protein
VRGGLPAEQEGDRARSWVHRHYQGTAPHLGPGPGKARRGIAGYARRPWQHGSSQQQPDHSTRSSSMMQDAKQRADADPAMGRQWAGNGNGNGNRRTGGGRGDVVWLAVAMALPLVLADGIQTTVDRQAWSVVVWLEVSEVGLCLWLWLRHQYQSTRGTLIRGTRTSTIINAISTNTRQRPLGQPWDCLKLGTGDD